MGACGIKLDPKALRMVRGVREAVEITKRVVSGKFCQGYPGEVFKVTPSIQARLGQGADGEGVHLLHRLRRCWRWPASSPTARR